MIGWINKVIYQSSKFSESYNADYLWPAEKRLFEDISKHSRIADLGVGAGRTTKYLLPKASYYKCYDVSLNYIKSVKNRYVDINAVVQDFKNKNFFSERDEFDYVIISFNSIDYVNHDTRVSLLEQISKVLSPKGILIFSTHNFHYNIPTKSYSIFIRFYRRIIKFLLLLNKRKYPEVKYVQDSGLKGTLITYYISINSQINQLKKIFNDDIRITVLDKNGRVIPPKEYHYSNKEQPWFYYKLEKIHHD